MESGPRPVLKKPFYKRWWFRIIAFLALLYMVGVLLLIKDWYQTPAAVERIHARKVTMEMVEGKKLPPYPPIDRMNDTVAGYDVNENGVRDDVEIEIHRRHTDSPKIRAAQLQYAMALQAQLTEVFSKGTLVAVFQEKDRALDCVRSLYKLDKSGLPKDRPVEEWTGDEVALSNSLAKERSESINVLVEEIEGFIVNTERREKTFTASYKYATSYSESKKREVCDVSEL